MEKIFIKKIISVYSTVLNKMERQLCFFFKKLFKFFLGDRVFKLGKRYEQDLLNIKFMYLKVSSEYKLITCNAGENDIT